MLARSTRDRTASTSAEPKQSNGFKRRFRQVAGAAVVGAVYWAGVRPWMMTWGATAAEATSELPGDDLLPEPDGQSTMAITIDAPPEDIWPWLLQLGQERGGFYSYTWAENLFGFDIHNADELVPEYQDLAVGETVRLARADRFPDAELEVASMTRDQSLVLRTPDAPHWWVWAFVLEPVADTETRLLVRARIRLPENRLFRFGSQLLLDPVTFVMTRGMLLGIKSRAEHTGQGKGPAAVDIDTRTDDGRVDRPSTGPSEAAE